MKQYIVSDNMFDIKLIDDTDKIVEHIAPLCKNSGFQEVEVTPAIIKRYKYFGTDIGSIIAFKKDSPAGFIVYFKGKKHLYMLSLFVKEAERRQGLATLLLNKLEEIAKDKNKDELRWKMSKDNETAVEFYNKIGYSSREEDKRNKNKWIYKRFLNEGKNIKNYTG